MNRRAFLLSALGVGTAAAAVAFAGSRLSNVLLNPCIDEPLPPDLARHEVISEAWEGLDPSMVWDSHVHLLGFGDSGSGATVNPAMENPANLVRFLQTKFFINSGCVDTQPGHSDISYVQRVVKLIQAFPAGFRVLLLAFDRYHNEAGQASSSWTAFYTPDHYARAVARHFPDRFEWAASIHPYREDCVHALEDAASSGVRAVKWLPSAMGIHPGSPLCDRFYEAMARFDIPLITHAGDEYAVLGRGGQSLGNPLYLRRALEHGVRVIVAHCATMGASRDIDKGKHGPWVDNFQLFSRLMDDPRYRDRLYGDISAITLIFRVGEALTTLIRRTDWHHRLLNGSDYPLPGIVPLISLRKLVEQGMVTSAQAKVLGAIRRYNALLFDFVLKRQLTADETKFHGQVFETRRIFSPVKT